jgi:hypothetical protein
MRLRLSQHLKYLAATSVVLLSTVGVVLGTTGISLGTSTACGCESSESWGSEEINVGEVEEGASVRRMVTSAPAPEALSEITTRLSDETYFRLLKTCEPNSIARGATCTAEVLFDAPDAAGRYTTIVEITGDGAGGRRRDRITVTGTVR